MKRVLGHFDRCQAVGDKIRGERDRLTSLESFRLTKQQKIALRRAKILQAIRERA